MADRFPFRYVEAQAVCLEEEVFEREQEEIDILEGDAKDKEEAAKKAEAERKAAAAARYHTIRQGDTLGALARKYRTSVKTLCRLNGIKETTTLRLGKKLRVK